MKRQRSAAGETACVVLLALGSLGAGEPSEGFQTLFNGKDLSGWKVPENDGGHWRVVDGVIDYDARSEAEGGNDRRSLWSEKSYRDFVLRIDWRIRPEGGLKHRVPLMLPNGDYRTSEDGAVEEVEIEDVDSGIYLRGTSRAQINIWMWPVGSGEVWAFRKDSSMPPEVRAACTPSKRADKPRGEWNRFEITLKADRLWVKLNGEEVIRNARLPGIPEEGRIALQHHGSWDAKAGSWQKTYGPGRWSGAPSLVQFRNIFIRELE